MFFIPGCSNFVNVKVMIQMGTFLSRVYQDGYNPRSYSDDFVSLYFLLFCILLFFVIFYFVIFCDFLFCYFL